MVDILFDCKYRQNNGDIQMFLHFFVFCIYKVLQHCNVVVDDNVYVIPMVLKNKTIGI